MRLRRWATRQLQHGDLTTLGHVAKGEHVHDAERLARLRQRSFIAAREPPRITIVGRLALLIKRLLIR